MDAAAETVQSLFLDFIGGYYENDDAISHYEAQIVDMLNVNKSTLFVNFSNLDEYNPALAIAIQDNYYRFDPYLRKSLVDAVKKVKIHAKESERREKLLTQGKDDAENPLNPVLDVDTMAMEEEEDKNVYFVAFFNLPRVEKIRGMKTATIGRLMSICGTVTRSSDVRPELLYGSFTCTTCGTRHPSVDQQFQYTEPPICSNAQCGKRDFQLIMDESAFIDWQRLRVQENADEIPAGSMPRCIDVICRNDVVEIAKAGDKMLFTGFTAVIPDTAKLGDTATGVKTFSGRGDGLGEGVSGLKAMGVREFNYKMLFIACTVQVVSQHKERDVVNLNDLRGIETGIDVHDLSEEDQQEIINMRNTSQLYSKMADSICPTVHGHSEVKRGVLLMMLGGVHKVTHEGINLRGDINVCIVGDPSCAKSQFLKYVHGFLPRSIYTSGKSSSAAGLTASVVRDSETGEYCIEAGALMLADNGICCIDEFDKMDNADQVAIHEAMEQQTISITKAGIQATLNARASILAAANPVFGRYDRSKPLKANIAVSAPIMSRFDLFFIIVDESNPELDEAIARHIIGVHSAGGKRRAAAAAPFSTEQLQKYIRFARTLNPQFTPASQKKIVECYRLLRQQDILGANKTAYRITVRQLESLVRLSEALARLHLDNEIKSAYVLEALRLLQKSIIFVETADVMLDDNEEMMEAERFRSGDEDDQSEQGEPDGDAGDGGDDGMDGDHGVTGAEGPSAAAADDSVEQPAKKPRTGDAEEQGVKVKMEKKPKTKVSMEFYKEVSTIIILYLKKEEDAQMDVEYRGRQWKDIIAMYMDLEGVDGSEETERLVYLIIRRMVKQDGLLVEVGEYAEGVRNEEKYLRLHPSHQEQI